MLAAMHKYVNINPEEFPAALVERLQLQRLLPLAIDRAIFENLPALSERASSVACNTTAELILKVFSQSFHSSNLSLVSLVQCCNRFWASSECMGQGVRTGIFA